MAKPFRSRIPLIIKKPIRFLLRKKNDFYSQQQFAPGIVGIWLNPFYLARKELRREMTRFAPLMRGRLLDVGCGTKPYRELFSSASDYVGLEYDSPINRVAKRADYFYDGNTLPFEDASYDGVICNQVLEHVFNPDQFLHEISRVVKPGGDLLLTVPFVWDEHEQPWDYARYSSFGLKSLLERNGFVVVEQRKTNADVRVLFQLINAYLYKILHTANLSVNLVVCAVVMAPFTLLGIVLGKLLPANPDLYLDQVVLARRRAE
jgi:SAM-dependent methyltransferase